MPQLAITLLPGGAFLDVGLGASRAFTGPTNRPATWRALIDSGAVITAISPRVVLSLRPQQIGVIPVTRAGATLVWRENYHVRIRFGSHKGPRRWFAIEAVAVQPATPDVDVLIGMDLLIKIDMTWFGSRRLVLIDH
jgi:hypothetical protein